MFHSRFRHRHRHAFGNDRYGDVPGHWGRSGHTLRPDIQSDDAEAPAVKSTDLADAAEPSDIAARAITPGKPVRIFICMGKSCHRGQGGRALLESLRHEIARLGTAAASIDAMPCGCLDLCKDGPVAVAYRGKAAQSSRPPHGALSELLHRPVATFRHVTPTDAGHIIAAVMAT